MLVFAVPKQPSTDPMESFTQRMEEMQRSFTQQMQDLAGKLKPKKHKLKPKKQSRQDKGDSKIHIDGSSLANPPPPPLYPVGDFSSSRKVQRTTRRTTKGKFNGSMKNYKDGAKQQRKPSRIELELEEATAVNGPDALAKLN
jgi:hypothetical protein